MTANNRNLLMALALASATVFVPAANATLMKAATFDEKVENAAAIVVGKCVKTESRWDPSHKWILTYSTFRVEKTIKGNASGDVTLVTPGGHVGDVYQDSIGVPEFREGSDNVVFVKNTEVGPTVLYFDQGAYDIRKDSTGERIVVPVETDSVSIDTQRGVAVPAESAVPLSAFEGKVRTSERKTALNRMEMMRRQQQRPVTSVWSSVARYRYLFVIAILGLILATYQLVRR